MSSVSVKKNATTAKQRREERKVRAKEHLKAMDVFNADRDQPSDVHDFLDEQNIDEMNRIVGRGMRSCLDDFQTELLDMFEAIVCPESPGVTIREQSQRFAIEVLVLASRHPEQGKGPKFVYNVWKTVIFLACVIPRRHRGQDVLVGALSRLKSAEKHWRHLRGLHPTKYPDGPHDTNYTAEEWLNLNSFVARLFATDALRVGDLGIWQLRCGLEEVIIMKHMFHGHQWVATCRVLVACEWLFHCSPKFLRYCLRNKYSSNRSDKAPGLYAPGSLFSGHKAFNTERWGYWKRKLHQYGKAPQYSITDLPEVIEEVLDIMTQTEMAFASGAPVQYLEQ